jgi:NAD(P)-dependent dehydrogenase (short-subunit alcohol dehydrogenase family)
MVTQVGLAPKASETKPQAQNFVRCPWPAEIAAAAVFLLDDRTSSFITGQTICVDGGFTVAGISGGASAAAAFPAR